MRHPLAPAAALVGVLVTASPVAAGPMLFTFQGTWTFHDPQVDSPTFWAAMGAYGVTWGTPVSFSMLLDDTAPPSGSSSYPDALRRVDLTVGSLSLGCRDASCRVPTNGASLTTVAAPGFFDTAPSISGLPSIGYGFVPAFFDLRANTSSTSTSLVDALADVAAWQQVSLMIGFADGPNGPAGGGVFLGHSVGMTLASPPIPTPEPASLPLAVAGAFLAALFLASKARARTL